MILLNADYSWVDVGTLIISTLSLIVAGVAAYNLVKGNKDIQSQVTSLATMAKSIQSYNSVVMEGYRKVNMPDFELKHVDLRYGNHIEIRCTNTGGEAKIVRVVPYDDMEYKTPINHDYTALVKQHNDYSLILIKISPNRVEHIERIAFYIISEDVNGNTYKQLLKQVPGIQGNPKFVRHSPEFIREKL